MSENGRAIGNIGRVKFVGNNGNGLDYFQITFKNEQILKTALRSEEFQRIAGLKIGVCENGWMCVRQSGTREFSLACMLANAFPDQAQRTMSTGNTAQKYPRLAKLPA